MAKMIRKGDLPTKTCATCGLHFAWRRKWEKTGMRSSTVQSAAAEKSPPLARPAPKHSKSILLIIFVRRCQKPSLL
jgi:hypothetical protein